MRVCVGTRNPSKIAGVGRAFREVFGEPDIVSVEASTRIPPQPIGMSVIVEGARRRALEALGRAPGCDVGVGVEAGLYLLGDRVFDVQVVYLVAADGSESLGLSPSFMVPEPFARALALGEARELEEVVDRHFGTSDVGSKGGLIKLLTRSLVTREDLTYYATLMALVPLMNRELYSAGADRSSLASRKYPLQ